MTIEENENLSYLSSKLERLRKFVTMRAYERHKKQILKSISKIETSLENQKQYLNKKYNNRTPYHFA